MAHRPTALLRLGEVGRGVAGEQVGGLPAAEQEQPDDEHDEQAALGPDRGDPAADGGEAVAELQPGASSAAPHQTGERLGHHRRAGGHRGRGDAAPRRLVAEDVLDDERPDRDGGAERRCSDDLPAGQDAEDTPLEVGPGNVVDAADRSEVVSPQRSWIVECNVVSPPADGHRALTVGLVAMVTLVAFETLAVITILPDISDDLGGIAWYGWVSTAFFLGTMVGIVFAGEQADRHGAGRPVRRRARAVRRSGWWSVGWRRRCPSSSSADSSKGSALESCRRSGTWRSAGCTASRSGRGCSPCCRRRGSFPGLIGPALAERISTWVGWRWVFLGLLPFVAIAGSLIVPEMMRLTALRLGRAERGTVPSPPAGRGGQGGRRGGDGRRRLHGVALVAGPGARRWRPRRRRAIAPVDASGHVARRRRTAGSGACHAGLLTFAFFGTDTFVPHALTAGRDRSTFAGSIAVTVATLAWTSGAWVQERWIVRTGEAFFVRTGYLVLAPGIAVVAVAAMPDVVPFWVIHVGWAVAGLGMGLAYSAHAQAVLRCSPAERYGAATASLQLLDNLGVALGTGAVGVIVTTGDDLGWDPGRTVAWR